MSRRKARPGIDVLEGRSLLSSLAYSLTTDKSVYQAGDPVQIRFTETNHGSRPITVLLAPADFKITEGNTTVWESNPDSLSQTPTSVTLQPGQSVSQAATWRATQSFMGTEINLWGSFVASNSNAFKVTAAFQIKDPLVTSLSTNQTTYRVGQPVQITSHTINTSDHPVTFVTTQIPGGGFAIAQNGSKIWSSGPADDVLDSVAIETQTIQPGEATKYTATWDGLPASSGSTASTATGSFTASLAGESAGPTATFQITSSIPDSKACGIRFANTVDLDSPTANHGASPNPNSQRGINHL
jgi:hypothetical protein